MYTRTHKHIDTRTNAQTHTRKHANTHVHTHILTYAHMHIHTHTHTRTHLNTCTRTHLQTNTCKNGHTPTRIHTHTLTHTCKQALVQTQTNTSTKYTNYLGDRRCWWKQVRYLPNQQFGHKRAGASSTHSRRGEKELSSLLNDKADVRGNQQKMFCGITGYCIEVIICGYDLFLPLSRLLRRNLTSSFRVWLTCFFINSSSRGARYSMPRLTPRFSYGLLLM